MPVRLRPGPRLLSAFVLLVGVAIGIVQWVWPGPQSKPTTYLTGILCVVMVLLIGLGFRSNAYPLQRPWKIPAERSKGSLRDILKGFLCWGASILLALFAGLALRFKLIPDDAVGVIPAMAPTLILMVIGTYFVGIGFFKWLFGSGS